MSQIEEKGAVFVRAEQPAWYPAIREVERRAFGRDGEANLVETLRQEAAFNPDFSLVAIKDGVLVGHVVLFPVTLALDSGETGQAMGLGPIAVLPEYQKVGIGAALIYQSFEICMRHEQGALFLLGDPAYYGRFGFKPAAAFGFRCLYDVPEGAFQAREIRAGALNGLSGVVKYHPAFDSVE